MTIATGYRRLFGSALMIAAASLIFFAPPARGQAVNPLQAQVNQAVNDSLRLIGLGDYADAITAAKSAAKMQPDNAIAYNNLAVAYAGLNQWDQAIAAIRQAMRLQPAFQLAINNLAWFLGAAPSPITVAGVSQTAGAWLDLSLGYYQLQRYMDSIGAAQQALQLDPNSAAADNNIAAAYASMGMWDQAIQAAQAALSLNPNFQLAQNNLAWAESGKQDAGPSGQ